MQVRKIVSSAYQRTIELLTGKRNLVQALAEKLLEKEVRPTVAHNVRSACALQQRLSRDACCSASRSVCKDCLLPRSSDVPHTKAEDVVHCCNSLQSFKNSRHGQGRSSTGRCVW